MCVDPQHMNTFVCWGSCICVLSNTCVLGSCIYVLGVNVFVCTSGSCIYVLGVTYLCVGGHEYLCVA